MIELKPNPYNKFNCPECYSVNIQLVSYTLQGIHLLADCKCNNCTTEFYHSIPSGLSLLNPVVIGKTTRKLYGTFSSGYFAESLFKSQKKPITDELKIEKHVNFTNTEIVVLNCLDTTYNNVVLKLLNAQYYLDYFQNIGVLVIVPKSFEWLIPLDVTEYWVVDLPLSQINHWYIKLNDFFTNELNRFKKVYFSLAFSHPHPFRTDIEKFSKIPRFNITNFDTNEMIFTFISHKEKFWFQRRITDSLFKLLKSLKLTPFFTRIFEYSQNLKFIYLSKKIRQKYPNAKFYITGTGQNGKFPDSIIDKRVTEINPEIEKQWCEIYSKSHLVIGIHGSNMLLASAHAAGVIEILPYSMMGNIFQDILLPYTDRSLIYFCRFVDEFAKPKHVCEIVSSIIDNYKNFKHTMSDDFLKQSLMQDVNFWKTQPKK